MTKRRFDPDDAREWLNRARASLERAMVPGRYLEDPCFDAQQATEKAIKGVLLHKKKPFPYTHDIARLLEIVRQLGLDVPEAVSYGDRLTRYAYVTRYPGISEPVSEADYREALATAEAVVLWAEEQIGYRAG